MRATPSRWRGPVVTLGLIAFLEIFARLVHRIPNPSGLLVLTVVFAAFDGGIMTGMISAFLSWLFLSYHSSLGDAAFVYEHSVRVRVIVWTVAMPAMALLVGVLKRRADRGAVALRNIAAMEARQAERENISAELQESEKRFRRIVETAEEGIWVHDQEGRVVYANDKMASLLGYLPKEIMGRPFFDFMDDEARATARELYARRRAGVAERFEFRLRRKNGEDLWVLISASPIMDEAGCFAGSLGMLTDITDRKRAEEDIRRTNEELERLISQRTERLLTLERQRAEDEQLAATGRMAARIAHEINNPLASIKNSFLLVSQAVPADHRYYSYVSRIEAEIDRIRRIVRGMFDLYRPEQEIPSRFRVNDTAREVASLLEAGSDDHRIEIRVTPTRAMDDVEFTEGPIRQILFNLLQNAIDASPPGGVVDVETGLVDGKIRLVVRDHGPGIPEADAERIFLPFFTTKKGLERTGLGLGLSVTRNLVDLLKGSIRFENHPDGGAVFTVELPLRRDDAAAN